MTIQKKFGLSRLFSTNAGFADLKALGLDGFEESFLAISRQFFLNFSMPESQNWLRAFHEAERVFPVPFGASIAHGIAIALNELQNARQRDFSYIKPDDPVAELSITSEERHIMQTLKSLRAGKIGEAQTHAMLVCEGGDSARFLAALERLCIITGDVSEPQLQNTIGKT